MNTTFILSSVLCLLSSVVWSATPPNSPVINTATATYSIGTNNLTASSTATVNTAACSGIGIKVDLMQYLPPAQAVLAQAGASTGTVMPTGYSPSGAASGPFAALGNPLLPGNLTPTPLPTNLLLSPLSDASGKPIASYSHNEPVFVRVIDYDANINPSVADTVSVKLTTSGGDSEVLQLTETGLSTGIFVGTMPSVFAAAGATATPNDGKITLTTQNETISVTYNHPNCASGVNIASINSVLMDPYGTIFDSKTGAPVNGVQVSLMSTLNNLPATVFCDDGVTVMPQPVSSGSNTICDAAMAAGSFRFPKMAAGSYKLAVVPPPGHLFPSSVAPANLPAMVGTPAAAPVILGSPGQTPGGSYGGTFTLTGTALKMDIPLDLGSTSMTIQKSSDIAQVGIGEFVPYTLTLTNNSATSAMTGAQIADHTPPGFRYRKGSARQNGTPLPDPLISADARTLIFSLNNIAASGVATIRYVLEVTSGAHPGTAENTVAATGGNITSNSARADVLVTGDLFNSKAFLIGRVVVGSCDDKVDNDAKGLANARIVLEDGTYILTDKEGRWHIDNVRAGTHVVQLDLDSLPKDYEVIACEKNSRFAGRNYSQFVNLRGGSLWRADFYVQKKASVTPDYHALANAETSAKVSAESAELIPENKSAAEDPTHLVEKLPYDEMWLSKAQPGNEWLHPQESFHPNLPVMKVAVKHDPAQRLVLTVNGEAVSPLLFDGTQLNAAHSVALSLWNAVPVIEGDNRVELVINDANGKEVSRTTRKIHYASSPDHVELVPQQSRLFADGKTRPVIAVRVLDKDGMPVRRGLNGDFLLNDPYRSHDRNVGIDNEALNGRSGGKARYEIQSDGLALIELEPTTQTGVAVLNFPFNDKLTHEVRAWLEPGQRDWILVGFGQGTLGQKTLSGNMQALRDANADQQLFDQDKLAFYAKGSIRGDYLLTLAYDTSKPTGDPLLMQVVNPTQYYTLYADASQANYDAASSSKLYLKLERKQFYALFGDFDTGLTVTELSRYSRTVNGVKSEYKGEKVGYNAFATVTAQAYVKDEIQGNGTSGIYKLSRGNLVINSDKVRLETRDRFQSQIIVSTQTLTRYLDYDIDYGTTTSQATLTFNEPIAPTDSNFNPTYIIAEYESADPADQKVTAGGRGSYKPVRGLEIGASLIHDGTVGASGNLEGVDTTYQINDKTKLHAELAATNTNREGVGPAGGSAMLADVVHHEEKWDSKVYLSEQTLGFGMGQQAASESDTRKYGADVRLKLSDTMQFLGQSSVQSSQSSGTQTSMIVGKMILRASDSLTAYYGAGSSQNQSVGIKTQSRQLIAGTTYTMPDKKLSFSGDVAVGNSAGSVAMPNTLSLGSDYKVTEHSNVFVKQEFARGNQIASNTTSAGIRTQPWTGNELTASVGDNVTNDTGRLYSNLGMVQRWQINEHWQTNFSVARSQTLYNSAALPLNVSTPLPFGSMPLPSGEMTDYTATAVGAAYHDKTWNYNGRIEIRNSSIDQQRNVKLGMQHTLDQGRTMAAGYTLAVANSGNGDTRNGDLRLSYAFRPNDSRWVWVDRFDSLSQSSQTTGSSLNGEKRVNNLNTNYMPNRHTQISLQYGSKYVLETIDSVDYKGYTDLIGTEIRHDLTQDWDIGIYGSVMRSLSVGVRNYGLGSSLGYKVMDNMWLSVGYNVLGLSDRDFSGASYQARGPYITARMKVDQDTLGLNKGTELIRPMPQE